VGGMDSEGGGRWTGGGLRGRDEAAMRNAGGFTSGWHCGGPALQPTSSHTCLAMRGGSAGQSSVRLIARRIAWPTCTSNEVRIASTTALLH
jgi:hypothetical protein